MKITKMLHVASLAGLSLLHAYGQSEVDWTNTAGGDYDDASNWSSNPVVPGQDDRLRFSESVSSGTYTVTLTQDEVARNMVNTTGNPSFDLDGNKWRFLNAVAAATWSMAFGGANGAGDTLFSNGTIDNYGRFGIGGGNTLSARSVTLDNITLNNLLSTNTNLRDIDVGVNAIGTTTAAGASGHSLTIIGSTVTARNMRAAAASGAAGNTINIQGASDVSLAAMTVGWTDGGNNAINISGASTVDNQGSMTIGNTGSTGNVVNIEGMDTLYDSGIGIWINNDSNTLRIRDNATVKLAGSINVMSVEGAAGHLIEVSGGATLDLQGAIGFNSLAAGNHDNGSFTISDAGTRVMTEWIQVGGGSSTGNTFTVNDGTLTVGHTSPNAFVFVTGGGNAVALNGGNITVQNTTETGYIRATAGNALTIDGATVTVDQVRIFGNESMEFNSGVLNVRAFNPSTAVGTAGDFTVGSGSGVTAILNLVGVNEHRFRDLTLMDDSVINFILNGASEGNYSFTTMTGELGYSGMLGVSLNFTPEAGDSFTLFRNFVSQSGTFSEFDLPTLQDGLAWEFDHASGTLHIIPEPAALFSVALVGFLAVCLILRRKALKGQMSMSYR